MREPPQESGASGSRLGNGWEAQEPALMFLSLVLHRREAIQSPGLLVRQEQNPDFPPFDRRVKLLNEAEAGPLEDQDTPQCPSAFIPHYAKRVPGGLQLMYHVRAAESSPAATGGPRQLGAPGPGRKTAWERRQSSGVRK